MSGLDRTQLARRGRPAGGALIRLCQFADGPQRGVRYLEVRTGSGLAFTVLVDRGMDIGDLEHAGTPIGWQSPAGFRAPWLTDLEGDGGLGFMRAFSGFWVTCGLDHIRRPEADGARVHPLHGRGTLEPARLLGYGADWRGDQLVLWAEGEVRQAILLGETLARRRRIEAVAGSDEIRVSDRVTNEGFVATPHMLLYHVNIGWPVLDEGARLRAPIRDTIWVSRPPAERPAGYRTQAGPLDGFGQQVHVHRVVGDADAQVPAALINDRLGLGVALDFDQGVLPWLQQWQCFEPGVYALGIEPCTHRFATRAELAGTGELGGLAPGQSVDYASRVRVLVGADAIAGFDRAVEAIHPQPAEEFPA